jgi:hypothetical protein
LRRPATRVGLRPSRRGERASSGPESQTNQLRKAPKSSSAHKRPAVCNDHAARSLGAGGQSDTTVFFLCAPAFSSSYEVIAKLTDATSTQPLLRTSRVNLENRPRHGG